jgi:O-antigen ligase
MFAFSARALPMDHRLESVLILLVMVGLAGLLGMAIVSGNWIYVSVILTMPLLLLWPVQVSLGLFAFLAPFEFVSALGEGSTGRTLTWYVGAMAGVVLFGTGLIRNRLQRPTMTTVWWFLFALWGAASIVWALDPQSAFDRSFTAFALVLLYAAALSLRIDENELRWLSALTVTGGFLAAVLCSYEFYNGSFYGFTMRGSLTLGAREIDPNIFAASLLLPLALALGGFLSSHGWLRRGLALAASGAIGMGILLTMSRGGLVALSVMIIMYFRRVGINWRLLAASAVLLGVLIAFAPPLLWQRLGIAGETGGAGRLDIWHVGLAAIRRYGVIGAGLDNFQYVYGNLAGYAPNFMGFDRSPHNIFLQAWVELGIPGLLLMIAAVVSQARALGQLRKKSAVLDTRVIACEAAFWGLLAASFFLELLWRKVFWLAWIMLALAIKNALRQSGDHLKRAEIAQIDSSRERDYSRPLTRPVLDLTRFSRSAALWRQ